SSCIINTHRCCREDTSVVIGDCDRVRSCCQVIVYCCCSEGTAIDRVSIWCCSSCYCSYGHCSVACSARCIRWCHHYICWSSCIINTHRCCREDTSVVIGDCNGVRSCCQVIIYCCCSEGTAIDRISIWCCSSCYCTYGHCSIACSTRCIR